MYRTIPCLLAILLSVGSSSAWAEVLNQPGIILSASDWNDVRIQNESGVTVFTLNGFRIKPTPSLQTQGGSIRMIDGAMPTLEITYDLGNDQGVSAAKLIARLTPHPHRVDIRCEIIGLPADAKVHTSMMERRVAADAIELPEVKLGLWTRHEYGGQPVEFPDGRLLRYRMGDQVMSLAFGNDNKANLTWKDAWAQHTLFNSGKNGVFTSQFSVLLTPADQPPEIIAAGWHDRPLGLWIGTDKTYNWWSQGPLQLDTSLVNTSRESRDVTVRYWVRNFAGDMIERQERDVTLASGETLATPIEIQPKHDREIYFAEYAAVDKQTGEEVFARTNLTLLPDHEFKGGPDQSIMGISAYWPLPSEAEAQRLMDRMGVRWLRNGNTHDYKNIIALRHNQIKKTYADDPTAHDAWIRNELQTCIDNANYAWEYGNEDNYSVRTITMGDTVKAEVRAQRIANYMDWLRAIRRIQKEMGPEAMKVKILSLGIAGMDVPFTDEMQAAGAWELLDGLALHPGRGNFAADYPVSNPYERGEVPPADYWNYYGSVRIAAELVKKYGSPGAPKELWLTEVYACSFPNSHWSDSLRHGAENALLSFALAKTENVKAVMWYQLFDSVWFDRLGVRPHDRESFFGLAQRDLSFRPAMLAYIAAAEALDQARFVRWLRIPGHPQARGLLFDTPRGPMAVLWDRTDGYVLTKKTPNYASPEPWIDLWKTKTRVQFPASGSEVRVINCIGQERRIAPERGKVMLTLDGAPRIVYGLSGLDE